MQIPLFPLSTVLFPGGWLPLRIFEVRYLDMVGRCQRDGTPFGVVCLTAGQEVLRPADPASGPAFAPEAFHAVGTLAQLQRLERPQPGLMQIECRGGPRFVLRGHERLKHGLWVGEAELLPEDLPAPLPDDLRPLRDGLQALLQRLQAQVEDGADGLPLRPPLHWDDCGWLANRWCELLPMPLPLKQRLLEQPSPVLRLELVADWLAQQQG